MATLEEKNQKVTETRTQLEEILNFNIEKNLIRNAKLGEDLSFKDAKSSFVGIQELAKQFNDWSIEELPFNHINTLFGQFKSTLTILNNISEFDSLTMDVTKRNQLIQEVNNNFETLQANTLQIADHLRLKELLLAGSSAELDERIDNLKKYEQENKVTQGKVDTILEEATKTLDALNKSAGKTAMTQYATYFENQATSHKKIAWGWLIAVSIVVIITLTAGVYSFFTIDTTLDTPGAVQQGVSKLIILSVLYYILVWISKNYKAHRHNYIVNKHRSNLLNSFEAFVKYSKEDEVTKNAVILQATQSIFSSQSSGYMNKDSDFEHPNQMIEIIRNVGNSTPK